MATVTDPIESPEDFARRVGRSLPQCDLNSAMARRALAEAIRSRDAAVRREALAEAARWLAQKVARWSEVTRDCRREAIALKAAGKDWKDAFDRECLSSSRCSGFADAAEHVRALASGDSDG